MRCTYPPREPMLICIPSEPYGSVEIVWSNSHGRVSCRYVPSRSVPVGQTSIQFPHCEQPSQPPYVPITVLTPRFPASMASSPIHSSQTRVQRLQRIQRCGSLATIGDRYFSGCAFFFSVKRSSTSPQSKITSCSSHSPPRSQTGQSSG